MAVWGGLRNNYEKKRSEKQRRKGKIKHLNAEFQRIARRDKKAFLSDQYHPHGIEMPKSKMAVWGGLINSCEKKRSEKQRRKGMI